MCPVHLQDSVFDHGHRAFGSSDEFSTATQPLTLCRCFTIHLTSVPTRRAATTVPIPTLPRAPIMMRHTANEMMTMLTSLTIFTTENSFLVALETARMNPSGASG